MSSATAPALQPAIDIITELKSAFAEYQQAVERPGLEFGKRLYELRKLTSAQGNHSCKGFLQKLQQAAVPQSNAYYWIHRYEVSIGERKPKPEKTINGVEPVSAVERTDYDRGYSDGHAAALHKVAALRFKSAPSKCYQRHIREVYAEIEGREQLSSLPETARVVTITNEEAASLIHKYEWLQTMGANTIACYGLKVNGELLGVACFGKGGSIEARDIIEDREDETICLMRGACVPWAPVNAGSFLVRHACRTASKDHGWTVFFAYSDPEAGEIGTVYQACGWTYVGVPKAGKHLSFTKGNQAISSYQFNRKYDALFQSIGWDGSQGKYEFLRRNGWTEIHNVPKKKYVWVEGENDQKKVLCANGWESLSYPTRQEYSMTGGAQ